MTTKNNSFLSKHSNAGLFNSSGVQNDNQYSTLNLNKNFKSLKIESVEPQSCTRDKKGIGKGDFTVFDNVKTQSWKKKTSPTKLSSNTLNFNDNTEKEDRKPWKKKCSSNHINNSTLSLHITAYENSVEAETDKCDGKLCEDSNGNEPRKKWKDLKELVDASSYVIRNPFEFPRQQNDKVQDPALSRYRASQQLLDPNGQSINHFTDRRISRMKRLKLTRMLYAGYKVSQAAKRLGISKSGARYARDRVNSTNLLQNRKAPNPALMDHRTNEFITEQILKKRKIKVGQLHKLCREHGFKLSLRQVRYRMRILGFQWRKMRRVQVISKPNQMKRLDARRYWESEGYPFSRYLFSDECTVVLGREQNYCWVRKGERVPCQGRLQHGKGFHIFAGISWFGATEILIWKSTARMNSAFYREHNIKDDSHKAHISFDTLDYLKELCIKTFAWPPQSPDWNAIEYVWRDLKEFIAEREPKSLGELKAFIIEFWKTKVTAEYCRKVIRLAMKNVQKSYDGLNHEHDAARDTLYHN